MPARILILATSLFLSVAAFPQFQIQESHSKAGLRGIHAVNDSVAWASGTGGTILRTTDGGAHWAKCAVPPDGADLDFRGIWAWDESEALVMSSGPGEASRVYRTTDACSTWAEISRNQYKDGFWDALIIPDDHVGYVVGDPVDGKFDIEILPVGLSDGHKSRMVGCPALPGEGAFAASNSSVLMIQGRGDLLIATGGTSGSRVLFSNFNSHCPAFPVSLGSQTESSGIFSLGAFDADHLVAVGGDYKRPDVSDGTAAWSSDGGKHWTAATKPPHGFRSAVTWSEPHHFWIAVGTNGSDVSRDDGKTWQRLGDGNWNAISGPFVVGPDGRIGRLPPQP